MYGRTAPSGNLGPGVFNVRPSVPILANDVPTTFMAVASEAAAPAAAVAAKIQEAPVAKMQVAATPAPQPPVAAGLGHQAVQHPVHAPTHTHKPTGKFCQIYFN